MLNEEQQQLIERFFAGELSAAELQQFKELLGADAAFKAEVELQRTVLSGIQKHGANQMRDELKQIKAEMQGQMQQYTPPGKGGWGKAFKWFFGVGSIAALVSALLIYLDKFPVKSPAIENLYRGLHSYDTTLQQFTITDTIYHVDTVYHTIHTKKVLPGDTITTYNVKETRRILQGTTDTLVEVKRDTVRKVYRNRNIQ